MNNDELIILKNKKNKLNNLYKKFKQKNSIDELLLKENINDILGQIEVCLKRVNYKKIPEKYKKITRAFRYANNLKKHSNYVFEYTLKTFNLIASENLIVSENLILSDFKILWKELPYDENPNDKEHSKNQFENYNEFLKGKELMPTINGVCKIIEFYYK